MQLSHNEDNNFSLSRFESMLKTNDVLFFDSNEFENIIHHYLEIGMINLAKKAVKLGLSQHPSSINLKLLKVEILVFEDKLDLADGLLAEVQDLEANNEEVYIQKAQIFSKRDEHHKAIQVLELALDVTDEAAEIYSMIGMEYLFLEDFENAKINFMNCLEADEEDYSALYNVMYCFDFLGEKEEAIEYLNMYLDKNPYCEVAWHQVGKQYFDLKDYKKALTAFDFAIISDEYFIGAYLEKGKVLEKLERYVEAIENYNVTLELDDPTSFAYLRIGKCFEKLGNDKLALSNFEKTVHEDPLLDKGWIAITDFYIKKKNFKKALYYINKAINIDEETWIRRCDILINLAEWETAVQNLLQANEFYPGIAEIEYRLSGLYFMLNNPDLAYKHLEKGLKADAEYYIIIEELFPEIFKRKSVKQLIDSYQKAS